VVKRVVLAFVVIEILIASGVTAQTLWPPAVFVPPAPSNVDHIRADFDVPQAPNSNTTRVVGTLVRTDVLMGPGVIGPPPTTVPYNAFFGPLGPGTYTYEIYLHYQDGTVELHSRQVLVVSTAPAFVPALSPIAVVMMALSLVVTALGVLRRTTG
jgi:hypothetical protein